MAPAITTMAECVDPETQVEDQINFTFVSGWLSTTYGVAWHDR